jgi:hypothetical protein
MRSVLPDIISHERVLKTVRGREGGRESERERVGYKPICGLTPPHKKKKIQENFKMIEQDIDFEGAGYHAHTHTHTERERERER